MYFRFFVFFLALLLQTINSHAQTRNLDGVPLPLNIVSTQPVEDSTFAGAWSGLWGHRLKHILVVENIKSDGNAEAIYAHGDMVSWGINKSWKRYPAKIEGNQLIVAGSGFVATYQKLPSGALMANFQSGRALSQAVLNPLNLEASKPKWTTAEFGIIASEFDQSGQ